MGQPESCYVEVVPGSRWYRATYNVEQGRPVEYFRFPEGASGYNFDSTISEDAGCICVEQDHRTYGWAGECGQNSVTVTVPIAVMVEFMRESQAQR